MTETGVTARMPQGFAKWGKWVLVAALAAAAIYWFRFQPVLVTGYPAATGDISAEVMGTGTLEARVQTVVSTKIPGRIAGMLVDQGDLVKAGQLLLRLDDSEFRQQVEIARSALEAAKATVERTQAEARRTEAIQVQARLEFQRRESLFASKSISANEIDKRKETLRVAEAEVDKARAAVAEARKSQVVAQSTIDYHLARLDDARILAPFDGLIIRRDRDPGDVVVPGTSIFLLISTGSLWVRAWIDETEMQKIAEGQATRVVFRAEPETVYRGRVVRLGRETDRETREFLVDVAVENLPRNWSVGQRADVFIETGHRQDVIVIPPHLIVRRGGETGVMVDRNGRAAFQPVQVGLRGQTRVEIAAGLAAGEMVVSAPGAGPVPEGRRLEVANREPGR